MTLLVPFLISPESDIEEAYKIQETFYNNFPDIDITFENRFCSQTILLNKLVDILNEYDKNKNLLCYVVMDNIKNMNFLTKIVNLNTTKLVISNDLNNISISLLLAKVASLKNIIYTCSIDEFYNNQKNQIRIMDINEKYKNFEIDDEEYDIKKNNEKCNLNIQKVLWKKGKVRHVYELSDENNLILSATDRLSAFDRQICEIPFKGAVLNNISRWWFNKTRFIVPNHFIQQLNESDILVEKCIPFKIEFVVRAYITGSGSTSMWKNYNDGSRYYCGHELPEGLVKNQKLKEIILTPTTKGIRDEIISSEDIISEGYMTEKEWNTCADYALKLFRFGQTEASNKGLILVDTKYEFGKTKNGTIKLIDEIHTPDSSRYWFKHSYAERFKNNLEPESFDKEVMRRWIKERYNPYDLDVDINISEEIKNKVMRKYMELYEIITGEKTNFYENKFFRPLLKRKSLYKLLR